MEPLNVPSAPAAIGPYCHAMKVGNLLFCSGQTPLDPESMRLVGATIETRPGECWRTSQSFWPAPACH